MGNRVIVFSRQLTLIDYGDQYTASKLGSKKERLVFNYLSSNLTNKFVLKEIPNAYSIRSDVCDSTKNVISIIQSLKMMMH